MTDNGTLYHESVTDLRRTLVVAAEKWRGVSETRRPQRTESSLHLDAYGAALMAYGYGYTLAAVLKVAEEKFGPEVAQALAAVADDLLMNGDSDNLNDDVMPEAGR